MVATMQLINTLNGDGVGTITADFGAHRPKAIGQINNFRFTGRIYHNCLPPREGGRHHDIFRRPDRDHRENHPSAR